MSAHLQCLIQCLHCPSKELCVDVLASNESLDKSKLISADGFPKLCYWTIGWCRNKSADPSRRDMEISYAGSKRCKVILIQTQNPRSKLQTAPFGAATKRTKTKLIQNPKSKLQNPKPRIQNPRSKIQNPKSQIQNPNSKIQTARLDFGFWIWSGRDRRRWLCSK